MSKIIRFVKLFSLFVVGEILFGGEVLMHERKKFWDVYEDEDYPQTGDI